MLLDRARALAAKRRSNWNALVLFGNLGFWFGGANAAISAGYHLHLLYFPGEVLPTHYPGYGFSLLIVAGLVGMAPVGLVLSNTLAFLIPPARRALSAEAETGKMPSYFESQRTLLKIVAVVTTPALILGLFDALRSWR